MRWGDVRICGTNALRRCHAAASPCTWLVNCPGWTNVERSHDLKTELIMPWPSNCNEAKTSCWALNKTLILVECSSWWTIHKGLPLWWHLGFKIIDILETCGKSPVSHQSWPNQCEPQSQPGLPQCLCWTRTFLKQLAVPLAPTCSPSAAISQLPR